MNCPYIQTALALVSNLDDSEWNIYNSLWKALMPFDHAAASLAYILTIVLCGCIGTLVMKTLETFIFSYQYPSMKKLGEMVGHVIDHFK